MERPATTHTVWKDLLTIQKGKEHIVARYDFQCLEPPCTLEKGTRRQSNILHLSHNLYYLRLDHPDLLDTMLITTFENRDSGHIYHVKPWHFDDSTRVMVDDIEPDTLSYKMLRITVMNHDPTSVHRRITCDDRLLLLDRRRRRLILNKDLNSVGHCDQVARGYHDPRIGYRQIGDTLEVHSVSVLDGSTLAERFLVRAQGLIRPDGSLEVITVLPK